MIGSPAAMRRASYPLHAYVGSNGGGKSLAMVFDSLRSLDAGRTVLSTVALYDVDGKLHPCYVPLLDVRQIIDAEHCDILMDEVTGVASAREHQSMPAQLVNKLVQLRRADCRVRWSTPWYNRADSVLREVTQAVTLCDGMMPARRTSDDGLSAWRENRLFRWTTYDAKKLKSFENDEPDRKAASAAKIRPECSQWFLRTANSRASTAYRTGDPVFRLTHTDETGRCIDCGGHRARPKCTCESTHERAKRAFSGVE